MSPCTTDIAVSTLGMPSMTIERRPSFSSRRHVLEFDMAYWIMRSKVLLSKKGFAVVPVDTFKIGDRYYVGKPGDYIACRTDDYHDIYIIEREIFGETYAVSSQTAAQES